MSNCHKSDWSFSRNNSLNSRGCIVPFASPRNVAGCQFLPNRHTPSRKNVILTSLAENGQFFVDSTRQILLVSLAVAVKLLMTLSSQGRHRCKIRLLALPEKCRSDSRNRSFFSRHEIPFSSFKFNEFIKPSYVSVLLYGSLHESVRSPTVVPCARAGAHPATRA